MRRRFVRGSALAAAAASAAGLAGAAPLLLRLEPRGGIRLLSAAELWLLAVFTAGVLAVLLGLSVAVGGWLRGPSLGAAAGRAAQRAEGRRSEPAARPQGPAPEEGDAAWWTVQMGLGLLAIYLLGWLALG